MTRYRTVCTEEGASGGVIAQRASAPKSEMLTALSTEAAGTATLPSPRPAALFAGGHHAWALRAPTHPLALSGGDIKLSGERSESAAARC